MELLVAALRHGHMDVFRKLLKMVHNDAAFHEAIACKNLAAAWLLLEQDVFDVDAGDKHGDTPLHCVVKLVDDEHQAHLLVRRLLERKADVNKEDVAGNTAVQVAAVLLKDRLVRAMLPEIDPKKMVVAGVSLKSFVEALLPGDDVTGPSSDMTDAVQWKLFRLLYAQDYDAFTEELRGLDQQQTRELLDADDGKNTLLQTACSSSHSLDVVKGLLDKGADPNHTAQRNRSPPLVIAAERKNYDVMETLLQGNRVKVNVNEEDAEGNTALHVVAEDRNLEMVVKLLKVGAKMDIKNNLGNYPISTAAMKDLMDMSVQRVGKRYKLCFGLFIQRHPPSLEPESSARTPTNSTDEGSPLTNPTNDGSRGEENDEAKVTVCPDLDKNVQRQRSGTEPAPSDDPDSSSETDEGSPLTNPTNDGSRGQEDNNVRVAVSPDVDNPRQEGGSPKLAKVSSRAAEVVGFYYITDTYREECILKHPLVRSFIHMKLYKAEKFHMVKIVLTIISEIFIFSYIHYRNSKDKIKYPDTQFNIIAFTFMIIFLVLNLVIELYHTLTTCRKNYAPLCLIILTLVFVFVPWNNEHYRVIVSLTILCLTSWSVFVSMGQTHYLSADRELFSAVTKKACFFLVWYIFLLIPFPVAYTILPGSEMASNVSSELQNGRIPTSYAELTFFNILIISLSVGFLILLGLYNLMNGLVVEGFEDIKEATFLRNIRSQARSLKDEAHLYSKLNIFEKNNDSVYIDPDDVGFVFVGADKYQIYAEDHSQIMKLIGGKAKVLKPPTIPQLCCNKVN